MSTAVRITLVIAGIALIATGILLFLVDVSRWWNITILATGAACSVLGTWVLEH